MLKHLARHARLYGFVLLLLLIPMLWLAGRYLAEANTTPIVEAAPTDFYTCTPASVAAFAGTPGRVHVRCTAPAPGGISFFAVCDADSARASRFLSIFTTAKVTGKNLVVFYTLSDTTSGPACGCGTGDCRVAWGAEVQQ